MCCSWVKKITFNNIKLLFSTNIKPSIRIIYHYYNIYKLLSSNDALLDCLFKYCEIYDLLFCFIILLKCLIGMLFIDSLLLILYEVDSYESSPRVEFMKLSRVYVNSRIW